MGMGGKKTSKPNPKPTIVAQPGSASGVQYSETQVATANANADQSSLLTQEEDENLKFRGVG